MVPRGVAQSRDRMNAECFVTSRHPSPCQWRQRILFVFKLKIGSEDWRLQSLMGCPQGAEQHAGSGLLGLQAAALAVIAPSPLAAMQELAFGLSHQKAGDGLLERGKAPLLMLRRGGNR